jgi:hypothetical protein
MGVTAGIAGAVGAVGSAAKSFAGAGGGGGGGGGTDQYTQLLRQQMAQNYQNVPLPDLSGAQNTAPYGTYTWLKDFVPEVYQPWIGQATQIQDSPEMRDAQLKTLGQMQGFTQGGLLPSDLQTLATIQQQQQGAASSQTQAVQDQLRQRGLAGSGAELAATLSANQGAANNAYALYNNALTDALNRQMSAIGQSNTMAGNIRSQDVGVSGQMAQIANNFNTQVQNLRTAAAANAAQTRNAAELQNEQGRQNIANQNVEIGNQNLDLYRQVAQQGFQNQMTKLGGMSNAINAQVQDLQASQAAAAQRQYGASQSFNAGLGQLQNLAKIGKDSNWFGLGTTKSNSPAGLSDWESSTQNNPDYQGVTWGY